MKSTASFLSSSILQCLTLVSLTTLSCLTPTHAQVDHKSLLMPSPTASSLGQYGDIPVSLYTGTPDITIPLGNIKGSELELPITLSYMAQGVKVEDNASWVGTGWSLNCTGVITRTTRGFEDGTRPRLAFPLPTSISSMHELLVNLSDGSHDTEPDLYFFNFPGYSGSFVLDENGESAISDHKEIRIQRDATNFSKFTITTEDGTQFIFSQVENTTYSAGNTISGVSSIYLSQIISSSKEETINFSYINETSKYYSLPRHVKWVRPGGIVIPEAQAPAFGLTVVNGLRLEHITTNFGINVEFVAEKTREDLAAVSTNQPKELKEIRFNNPDGVPSRRFLLEYETIETTQPYVQLASGDPPADNSTRYSNFRLYLKSVRAISHDGSSYSAPYLFTYYGRSAENKDLLPSKLSCAQDHWGYYNGAIANQDLWPGYAGPFGPVYDVRFNVPLHKSEYAANSPSVSFQGADRAPHAPFMKYGTLSWITYPTGGSTMFEFEPHRYLHRSDHGGPVMKTVSAVVQVYLSGSGTDLEAVASGPTAPTMTGRFSFEFNVTCWDPNTHEPVACDAAGSQVNYDKYQGNSVRLLDENGQEVIAAKWEPGDGGFWIYRNGLVDNEIGMLVPDNSGYITQEVPNLYLSPGTYTLKATKDPDGDTDVFGWYYFPQEVVVENEAEAPLGGGLRIKRIEQYDDDNTSIGTKTYDYGLGVLLDGPNYSTYTFRTQQGTPTWFQQVDVNHGDDPNLYLEVGSGPYLALGYSQGSSIGYASAIERQEGNGSIAYEYTTGVEYPDNNDNESNIVSMLFWNGDPALNEWIDLTITGGKPAWPFISQDHLDRKRGFLKSITHKNNLGQQILRKEFTPIMTDLKIVKGLRLKPLRPDVDWMYSQYRYSSGYVNVASSIAREAQLNPPSEIVQTTNFYYGAPNHKLLTKKESYGSQGSSHTTEYFYPDDYISITDPNHPVSHMKAADLHIIGEPLEVREYKDGKIIGGSLQVPAKFKGSANGFFIETSSIHRIRKGISTPTTRQLSDPTLPDGNIFVKETDLQYDENANLTQVIPTSEPSMALLWPQNLPSPSAKALNANAAQLFFSSFESPLGTLASEAAPAKTGERFLNSGSFNFSTDAGFDPADPSSLKMTYWFWNVDHWQFSGELDYSSQITSSGTRLDEVRVYPERAQMVTYTFDPLLGLTSETDANNRTTYFKYDEFGRLEIIMDHEQNVLQKVSYHFKGE